MLIDKYDVYQHLMDYWLSTMRDDVYMVLENGLTAYEELLPADLMVNRFFKKEKEAIEKLEAKKDEIINNKEEFEAEHTGEDGAPKK